MIKPSDIDFQRITPTKFEELSFRLIKRLGFDKVRWRQGSGDDGRDIEAIKYVNNELVGRFEEKWFFECKHYKKGVPPSKFDSKFAWASAEDAKNLVFILSSYITNNGDTWFENRKKGVKFNVHLVEGNELKEVLIEHIELVKEFGLVGPSLMLMSFLKDKWVINEIIPTWQSVYTTCSETNLELLNLNELLFLISLMEIHKTRNSEQSKLGDKDEDLFTENLHKIIEFGNLLYFKNHYGEIDFTNTTWNKIEWVEKVNYGEILDEAIEDSFPHSSINIVKYNGVIGFLGVLTNFNSSKNQIVKPFFIAQDSSLSITKFKTLTSKKTIEFKKKYTSIRQSVDIIDYHPDSFIWNVEEADDFLRRISETKDIS